MTYYGKILEDVICSPNPPENPIEDTLWWNSVNNNIYIFTQGKWVVNTPTVTASTVAWADVTGKPTTFPPTLPIPSSGVTGLDAILANKEPTIVPGSVSQYWRGDKTWQTLPLTDWSTLPGKPTTFPPTLPIPSSGVTGLDAAQAAQDTAIAGKASAVHTHPESEITNLVSDLAAKADLAGATFTGKVNMKGSTTAGAGLNLGQGGNPTEGLPGDIWMVSAGLGWWDNLAGTPVFAVTREQAQNITGQKTFTVQTRFAAGTALEASIRIAPTGTAPTTPVDGDIWIGNAAGAGNFNWRADGVSRQAMDLNTNQFISGIKMFTSQAWFPASTISATSIRIAHGVAPTTPGNGDFWSTTLGFYGRVNGVTVGPFTDTTALTTGLGGKEPTIAPGTTAQYWRGDKSWQTLDKTAVGLANVDNTSDASKPVSTAQAAADALKVNKAGDTVTGLLTFTGASNASFNGRVDILGVNNFINWAAKSWLAFSDDANLKGAFQFGNETSNTFRFYAANVANANRLVWSIQSYSDTAPITFAIPATFQDKVNTPASNTTRAGLNLGSGTNPTTPVAGDIWMTTASLMWWDAFNGLINIVVGDKNWQSISGRKTFSEATIFAASTTSIPSIRLPHGVAPSAPTNGDMWSTTAGFYGRVNGVTIGPFGTAGAGGIADAPNDGSTYGRKNLGWVVMAGGGSVTEAPTDGFQYARINANWAVVSYDYANLTGKPATFPPTLPIASSGITGLDAAQTAQDTAISARVLKAGDTMTGPLVLPGGTSSAVSLQFGGGAGGGMYASGSGSSYVQNFVVNASVKLLLDQSQVRANAPVRLQDGSVGTPALAFTNDTGSGFYRAASGDIRMAMGGADIVKFLTSDKSTTFSGKINLPLSGGAAPAPINFGTTSYNPTTPADGDFWLNGTLINWRATGITFTVVDTQSSQNITGRKEFGPSSSANAAMGIKHGVAPSAPQDGWMWTTTAGLYVRINGATVGPLDGATDISGKEPVIAPGSTAQYWRGDKSWQTLNATAVGLGNVDNTSDVNKPVSTAQATADALALPKAGGTMTGKLNTLVPTAATAGLNLGPTAVSPTTPVDGDIWITTTGNLWARILGTSVTLANLTQAQTFSGGDKIFTARTIQSNALIGNGTDGASNGTGIIMLKRTSGYNESIAFSDGAGGLRVVLNTMPDGRVVWRIGDNITDDIYFNTDGGATFNGAILAPTAARDTNNTQVATTAHLQASGAFATGSGFDNTTDINSFVTPGFYKDVSANAPNHPNAGIYYHFQTLKYGTSEYLQIAYPLGRSAAANGIWYRGLVSGVWSPWVQLLSTINSRDYAQRVTSAPTLDLTAEQISVLNPALRTTTATYIDGAGRIKTAAINAPRITYDPLTLIKKGFLNESARTNVAWWSQDLDNAYWVKAQTTVTPNLVTALDGTLTADKVVEDATLASLHTIGATFAATASVNYTFSMYLKAAERTKCQISMTGNSGGIVALIDLTAKTITLTGGGLIGTWTVGSCSIIEHIDGWFRVVITATTNAGLTSMACTLSLADATGAITYDGVAGSGMYVWGMQLENGNFASSYIPTVGANVLRTAEQTSTMALSSFAFSDIAGTYVIEHSFEGSRVDAGTDYLMSIIGTNNYIHLRTGAIIGGTDLIVSYNAVTQVDSGSMGVTVGKTVKIAVAWALNDIAITWNGATPQVDNVCTVPVNLTTLNLVTALAGTALCIKRFTYWPKRLTNAEIQALTSLS